MSWRNYHSRNFVDRDERNVQTQYDHDHDDRDSNYYDSYDQYERNQRGHGRRHGHGNYNDRGRGGRGRRDYSRNYNRNYNANNGQTGYCGRDDWRHRNKNKTSYTNKTSRDRWDNRNANDYGNHDQVKKQRRTTQNRHDGKQRRDERRRLTHFLSIRICNPLIVALGNSLTQEMVNQLPYLESCMIYPETFHISLNVIDLSSQMIIDDNINGNDNAYDGDRNETRKYDLSFIKNVDTWLNDYLFKKIAMTRLERERNASIRTTANTAIASQSSDKNGDDDKSETLTSINYKNNGNTSQSTGLQGIDDKKQNDHDMNNIKFEFDERFLKALNSFDFEKKFIECIEKMMKLNVYDEKNGLKVGINGVNTFNNKVLFLDVNECKYKSNIDDDDDDDNNDNWEKNRSSTTNFNENNSNSKGSNFNPRKQKHKHKQWKMKSGSSDNNNNNNNTNNNRTTSINTIECEEKQGSVDKIDTTSSNSSPSPSPSPVIEYFGLLFGLIAQTCKQFGIIAAREKFVPHCTFLKLSYMSDRDKKAFKNDNKRNGIFSWQINPHVVKNIINFENFQASMKKVSKTLTLTEDNGVHIHMDLNSNSFVQNVTEIGLCEMGNRQEGEYYNQAYKFNVVPC